MTGLNERKPRTETPLQKMMRQLNTLERRRAKIQAIDDQIISLKRQIAAELGVASADDGDVG